VTVTNLLGILRPGRVPLPVGRAGFKADRSGGASISYLENSNCCRDGVSSAYARIGKPPPTQWTSDYVGEPVQKPTNRNWPGRVVAPTTAPAVLTHSAPARCPPVRSLVLDLPPPFGPSAERATPSRLLRRRGGTRRSRGDIHAKPRPVPICQLQALPADCSWDQERDEVGRSPWRPGGGRRAGTPIRQASGAPSERAWSILILACSSLPTSLPGRIQLCGLGETTEPHQTTGPTPTQPLPCCGVS
jgi:hypothetical protein